MSLGNYIHFNYSSYKQRGLKTSGSSRPEKVSSLVYAHQQQLKKLVPPVPYMTLKDLERKLNFFYGDAKSGKGPSLTNEQRMQLQKILYEQLAGKVKNLQDYQIDWDDLSAIKVVNAGVLSEGGSGKRHLQGSEFTYYDAVVRRLERLHQIVEKTGIQGEDIAVKLQQFEQAYGIVYEEGKVILQKIQRHSNNRITADDLGKGTVSSFTQGINELLNLASVAVSTQILGELGEYVAAIMPEVYEAAVSGGVNELMGKITGTIAKSVTGSQRSVKAIDKTFVYGAQSGNRTTQKGKLVETIKIGDFGVLTDVTYTQDKIDVMMNIAGGKQLAASVKNINASSDSIHIHSGTSLLKFLQLYPVFGNHYLNVTANLRTDENGKMLKGSSRASSRDVALMHNALLSTIGTHSLIGGLLSKQKDGNGIYKAGNVQVFVVNTHGAGKGRFRVYAMSNLLDNIEQHIKVTGDITNEPKEWHNTFLSQAKGKTAYQAAYARCISILQELHSVKLRVSISKKHLI